MNWGDVTDALHKLLIKVVDSRELLDLHAQIDMAYWAKVMTVVTTVGMFVTGIAVYFAFQSLRASRKAASEAREVGEYQTQAYVHASKASFGYYGNIVVSCKNSGLTPATQFSVNGVAKLVKKGHVSASISFQNDGFKTWSALGASDELTVSIMENDPIVKEFADSAAYDDILLISGQIIYCTVFNHDHRTQFAFYVEGDTRDRFRRPTAKLITFSRLPKERMPKPSEHVDVRLDDNEHFVML